MSKQNPGQDPSGEGFQDQPNNPRSIRRLFGRIVEVGTACYFFWITADLFGNSDRAWWITGLILAADVILVAHIAYDLANNIDGSKFMVWAAACIIILILGGTVVYRMINRPTTPAFAIVCKNLYEQAGERPPVWMRYKTNNEIVMRPIPRFMWMRFTNLRPSAMMLDSFSVESAGPTANRWIELPQVDVMAGQLFWVWTPGDFTNAIEMGMDDLRAIAHNKTIGLGESIQGWMFFGYTNATPNDLRFRIWDATGQEFVEKIKMPPKGQINGTELQRAEFHILHKYTNVSGFRRIQ